jgi:organic radical activating enzyme
MTSSTGKCHVEVTPGSGQMTLIENPMNPTEVLSVLQKLIPLAHHHSISFTGGEPLLYHRFLGELLPHLQPLCPIYLETSGTQPAFLEAILPWVDIIAMDIKLPSATGEPAQFENHATFYQVAQTRPDTELFIKLIFTAETTSAELEAVREIVQDRAIPIILQPMTSLTDRTVHISPLDIFRIEQTLSQTFQDVRVIPQTHKMLNVL